MPLPEKLEKRNARCLVIVPAYNESARIVPVLDDLRQHAPWADVVVIDDGSADDTAQQAAAVAAMRPPGEVTVLQLPFNLGVGGAMQTGYLYAYKAGYKIAVQFDGDGQHCADQIESLIAPISGDQADLVVGSRLLGERTYRFSVMRWLGSRLLVGIVRMLTHVKVTDPTSGFRAASRRMIEFFSMHYPQSYLGDTVEALSTAAWHGMAVREVPAKMRESRHSSINSFIGLIHTIRICVALLIGRLEAKYPTPPENPRPQ